MNEESVKNKKFFNSLSVEEKNVLTVEHLKSLNRWDLKRVLCATLDVDNYMDDDALRSKLEKLIWER